MEGAFMPVRIRPRHTAVSDDYMDLVREMPLRPIRSDADQASAVRVLTRLMGRPNGTLSDGERDYVAAISRFVEDYDALTYQAPKGDRSPLEILRFLVREHGMNTAALGAVLGNQTAASLVLNGKRRLSLSHIRKLADHFKVDAGLFV